MLQLLLILLPLGPLWTFLPNLLQLYLQLLVLLSFLLLLLPEFPLCWDFQDWLNIMSQCSVFTWHQLVKTNIKKNKNNLQTYFILLFVLPLIIQFVQCVCLELFIAGWQLLTQFFQRNNLGCFSIMVAIFWYLQWPFTHSIIIQKPGYCYVSALSTCLPGT